MPQEQDYSGPRPQGSGVRRGEAVLRLWRLTLRSWIPSFGAGPRLMVLPSKRINMRLDYARSKDGQDAIHFLVGEAF